MAVKTAIDAIVFERCSRTEAAQKAGFTERALYLAFEKPEVAAYLNQQIEVLRLGERPRNIHRLADIRDQDENRNASVAAIKQLEGSDENAATLGGAPSVGVTIQVLSKPAPPAPAPIEGRSLRPSWSTLPEPEDEAAEAAARPLFKFEPDR